MRGIARNISPTGAFIETCDPCRIGARLSVTFSSDDARAEVTLLAEVRYLCHLAYGGLGQEEGEAKLSERVLRGMGVRFLEGSEVQAEAATGANQRGHVEQVQSALDAEVRMRVLH